MIVLIVTQTVKRFERLNYVLGGTEFFLSFRIIYN